MSKRITELRDHILETMLPDVPAEGWTMAGAEAACDEMGLPPDRLIAVFPDGLSDIVAHFSDWADRQMSEALAKMKSPPTRIRDRVEQAVRTRLTILEPHKDALRLALAYWSVPPRHLRAGQIVWRTADRIWDFAGDQATDYNRYTKRGLLSGILTATALVWMKDDSDDHEKTWSFLQNRIENAMELGQIIGGILPKKA